MLNSTAVGKSTATPAYALPPAKAR
jgi:hypothetical protein